MVTVGDKLLQSANSGADSAAPIHRIVVIIDRESELQGKAITETEFENVPGLELLHIYREQSQLQATSGTTYLEDGDQLIFIGPKDAIVSICRISELTGITIQIFKLPLSYQDLSADKTTTLSNLKTSQEAGISFLGNIIASISFRSKKSIFYGITATTFKATIAWSILAGMVGAMAAGILGMVEATFSAAALMVCTGCCQAMKARAQINWALLLMAASSIGLANALHVSEAASVLAAQILLLTAENPVFALAVIYLAMSLFAELTNPIFTATLAFPKILSLAEC